MIKNSFYPHAPQKDLKFQLSRPDAFTPFSRTPWAGTAITDLKKKEYPWVESQPIGESWEVLTPALQDEALLLKWLSTNKVLSLQVHPSLRDQSLNSGFSGKPEGWLIVDSREDAYVILGFSHKNSPEQLIHKIKTQSLKKEDLFIYKPHPMEYICVPPGCVHAMGPGIFAIEPQVILTDHEGVTFRISDWGRTYDSEGQEDPKGQLRELHIPESLISINWDLPREEDFIQKYVYSFDRIKTVKSHLENPFEIKVFKDEKWSLKDPKAYFAYTTWSGKTKISMDEETVTISCGSLWIGPHTRSIKADVQGIGALFSWKSI
jgi:mannose-6-phosphate isomerase